MEALDIEAIQQELQKLGHERLEPNDPLFMDHLARRLELQWHYEKIQTLLEQQQKQIQAANTEFSESLRKSYSEWINEGGSYLKKCIEEASNTLLEKNNSSGTGSLGSKRTFSFDSYAFWLSILAAFSAGLLLGWKFL